MCIRDRATIDSYVAQADFLIAYFHMLLIKCYGPVVLVKELPVLDLSLIHISRVLCLNTRIVPATG